MECPSCGVKGCTLVGVDGDCCLCEGGQIDVCRFCAFVANVGHGELEY